MWKTALIASVFGFLAGLAGVWAGFGLFQTAAAPPQSLHDLVHHELHLDADQAARIEALEAEFADEREALEARLAASRSVIGAALLADRTLSREVEQAAEQFHDVMGEMQLATLRHVLAMRSVLDADQQAVFDEKLAQTFDVRREE
ncbi:Spy/CpxP family protein refolding chaperone [Maricaulis sp. CAU 1757]